MEIEVRISPPPVFDFERLNQTKEIVREVGLDQFPSLRVAYVLWLYNTPQDQWERLGYRMRRLGNQEVNASDPQRILCELIKGGFLPSIVNSKSADDRFQYLDDEKLVSLRINLGVPASVLRLDFGQPLDKLSDVEL